MPNVATPPPARSSRSRRAQRGSAFVVTLIVLVVLTLIGLSLALVTQTEVMLGGNERVQTKIFYDADSGVNYAVARRLANNDRTATTLVLPDPDAGGAGALGIDTVLDISPFVPILDAPCELCEINQQDKELKRINHALTVTARRGRTPGGGGPRIPLAQETVSLMVDMQPLEKEEAMGASGNTGTIKF